MEKASVTQSNANINFLHQRRHHLQRNVTKEQFKYIHNYGILVYNIRITRPYKFIIPDSDDQVYVLVEIVEKIQVIDYYLKLQEISRKFHNYTPSNEVSCSKTTDIVQDIIKKFKEFLKKMLVEFSKEEINEIQLEKQIEDLDMWNLKDYYNFTFILKNQISLE
ncbi:hypothetical protein RhiirC2_792511 [Rhizophagus irregularis]|uniref:Uncharacterized protein n=1 Tax=Rhizophagus irregularis TaxID=588596 RepID=A0A2N1MH66_9GLOM|nr:hypothetical protein RhiirC2_792511 [Rhizophagus irregularis]